MRKKIMNFISYPLLLLLCFGICTTQSKVLSHEKQVQKLILLEYWKDLKSVLSNHPLPELKKNTAKQLALMMGVSSTPTADQEKLFTALTDITLESMIEIIDEKELINQVQHAYQALTSQQISAFINFYQQPETQNLGKKMPKILVEVIDSGSIVGSDILELKDIKELELENSK